jgi:thiamine transport system substrate-binding protein
MIEEKTDRYKAAKFSEGHYVQIEVAGMIQSSKNQKLARKFMDFMLQPGFQDVIPTSNWMWPAGKTSKPLPKAFDLLIKPEKSLMLDPETVARNRKAWTDEWLNATSQ